jgi:hypothetical protein
VVPVGAQGLRATVRGRTLQYKPVQLYPARACLRPASEMFGLEMFGLEMFGLEMFGPWFGLEMFRCGAVHCKLHAITIKSH